MAAKSAAQAAHYKSRIERGPQATAESNYIYRVFYMQTNNANTRSTSTAYYLITEPVMYN